MSSVSQKKGVQNLTARRATMISRSQPGPHATQGALARDLTHAGSALEDISQVSVRSSAPPAPDLCFDDDRAISPSRNDGGDSVLTRYFREMAMHPVLNPIDETAIARRVEDAEIAHWVALLSHSSAAKQILAVLESRIRCADTTEPLNIEVLDTLKRTLTARGKSAAAEARFSAACVAFASEIRLADTDRVWMAEAAALATDLVREPDVEETVADPDETWIRPRVARSSEYPRYLARVRRTHRAQELAKADFVRANLRLVVSVARRYNRGKMPLIDLIQEGNIGLMKAVERFDHKRGFRFSTYASWWIRHAISRALADKARAVRVPVHMLDTHARVTKVTNLFRAKNGREPTLKELEHDTGLSADKLELVQSFHMEAPLSLDRPVGDDDGRRFIDLLEESESRSPFEVLAARGWKEQLARLLHGLQPIEAKILTWRFGLDDGEELTLKEIGDKYNLSRERIRQLQEQALRKIRRQLEAAEAV